MNEITTLLICLQPHLNQTLLKQLAIISQSILCIPDRVTMLGMSRWSEAGGSYRTIQRFFKQDSIPWMKLNWALTKPKLEEESVVLVVADSTTVTKSGHCTNGLGRFFSSIYSRAVKGLAFQQIALVGVDSRRAYPILQEQISPADKTTSSEAVDASQPAQSEIVAEKPAPKKAKGRPKGSKNKNRKEPDFTPELTQLKRMLTETQALCANWKPLTYFVYDGALGNNAGVQMTRQVGMHLISKMRHDSVLYFAYQGEYSGRGRRKKYGERVKQRALSDDYLKHTETEDGIQTKTYQFTAYSKNIPNKLNFVLIVKTNLTTQKTAHVLLFSTDLNLNYDKLVDYYSLRFQIEFCFRDAKQHFGLEDFMVTEKHAVNNSANISMWMVNLSHCLLGLGKDASLLDLKSRYRGEKYVHQFIKMLPESAKVINIQPFLDKITPLGRIHKGKLAA